MTAIKTVNPNPVPGIPGAPLIWIVNPIGQQIVLQHVTPDINGPFSYTLSTLPNLVSIAPPNAAGGSVVALSQQNVADLLPSLQAFVTNGVLS